MPSVYQTSREQFEQRMRARRASTCLALARTAIASGRTVEAIDRLEEACALDPEAGEARLLLEELRPHEPDEPGTDADARPAARGEVARWSHWVAAGVAICALAALAILWPPSRPTTGRGPDAPTVPSARPNYEAPVAVEDQVPVPGLAAQLQQGAVGTSGATELSVPASSGEASGSETSAGDTSEARGGSVSVRLREEPVVTKALPIVPSGASGTTPASTTASTGTANSGSPSPAPAPLTTSAGTPSTATTGVESAPQSAAVASAAGSPAREPALPSPSPVLPPLERAAVRSEERVVLPSDATNAPASPNANLPSDAEEASLRSEASAAGEIQEILHRYADAYARLDAAAAQAVWPTVDQRALARAFEGLQSQGIQFDHCDLTVAGPDATAACRGRARYVPKVGSRQPLVERRQWTFHLRRGDAGWQIVQAEAR